MNKKGIELSLNTIIIAIIVIIVLIVVIFIFVQRSNIFGKSIDTTCSERGGRCAKSCSPDEYVLYNIKGCTPEGAPTTDEKQRGPCCIVAEQKQRE